MALVSPWVLVFTSWVFMKRGQLVCHPRLQREEEVGGEIHSGGIMGWQASEGYSGESNLQLEDPAGGGFPHQKGLPGEEAVTVIQIGRAGHRGQSWDRTSGSEPLTQIKWRGAEWKGLEDIGGIHSLGLSRQRSSCLFHSFLIPNTAGPREATQ